MGTSRFTAACLLSAVAIALTANIVIQPSMAQTFEPGQKICVMLAARGEDDQIVFRAGDRTAIFEPGTDSGFLNVAKLRAPMNGDAVSVSANNNLEPRIRTDCEVKTIRETAKNIGLSLNQANVGWNREKPNQIVSSLDTSTLAPNVNNIRRSTALLSPVLWNIADMPSDWILQNSFCYAIFDNGKALELGQLCF